MLKHNVWNINLCCRIRNHVNLCNSFRLNVQAVESRSVHFGQKLVTTMSKPMTKEVFGDLSEQQKNKILNWFTGSKVCSGLKRIKSQQHPEFPSGLPSTYQLSSMLLNFSDRTRTGKFNMIWPLTETEQKLSYLYQLILI